jgi:glycosyltransferase A (GT-A) superfamily protein (DUF2064 family)
MKNKGEGKSIKLTLKLVLNEEDRLRLLSMVEIVVGLAIEGGFCLFFFFFSPI